MIYNYWLILDSITTTLYKQVVVFYRFYLIKKKKKYNVTYVAEKILDKEERRRIEDYSWNTSSLQQSSTYEFSGKSLLPSGCIGSIQYF